MIVREFTSVHVSRKQGKIKKASVLMRLPQSLRPLTQSLLVEWLREGKGLLLWMVTR